MNKKDMEGKGITGLKINSIGHMHTEHWRKKDEPAERRLREGREEREKRVNKCGLDEKENNERSDIIKEKSKEKF